MGPRVRGAESIAEFKMGSIVVQWRCLFALSANMSYLIQVPVVWIVVRT